MTTDAARDKYLQRTYAVSLEEWNRILDAQGGGCAGCGSVGKTRSLHTDHSHKTKVVRGILCASCNSALRKLKDNPAIAKNLAKYLQEPPAVSVLGEERLANVRPRKRKRRPKRHGVRPVVDRKQVRKGHSPSAKAKPSKS